MKPLLVGELNPYGADPDFALYPSPPGCAGDRLCRLVMELGKEEYLERFDRVNLCEGKWMMRIARIEAYKITKSEVSKVVLLGRKVATAFDCELQPFRHDSRFVALPHPSGLCRAWNESGAFRRAREALRAAGVLP
jgi:hypothetical protein